MKQQMPDAYSRLGAILARENVSVPALQRKLEGAGASVNIKSLYRLTEDTPLQKIDLRIAGGICNALGITFGELITFGKPEARLRRMEPKTQARLDALMAKNNEGQLNAAERKEFVAMAEEAHRLSMENARTLLAERRRAGKPAVLPRRPASPKRPAMAA